MLRRFVEGISRIFIALSTIFFLAKSNINIIVFAIVMGFLMGWVILGFTYED